MKPAHIIIVWIIVWLVYNILLGQTGMASNVVRTILGMAFCVGIFYTIDKK